VETKYRASVDALLADLDGNATPWLTLTGPGYVTSVDGAARIDFQAGDPDGTAPAVSLVPGIANASVGRGSVTFSGLASGTHFFTLKAEDAFGKKAFVHFVVDVM